MLQTLKIGKDTSQALLWEKFQIINCMISFGSHFYFYCMQIVLLEFESWPVPREDGPMVQTQEPVYDVENTYT